MEIPEGFTNCRYVFTASGVLDPMGFGLGHQGLPGVTAEEVAGIAYSRFQARLIPTPAAMLNGWTFQGVQATKTVGGEPTVGEHMVPIVGTGGGTGTVLNSAILIRKNTAAGGRKNRGRMFFPPFNLEELSIAISGVLAPAFTASVQILLDDWHEDLSVFEAPPWLFHSDPADAPTPITSFSIQSLAATQRRRMR